MDEFRTPHGTIWLPKQDGIPRTKSGRPDMRYAICQDIGFYGIMGMHLCNAL